MANEVEKLKALGVDVEQPTRSVGKTTSIDELFEDEAVFVGLCVAAFPCSWTWPVGVYSANEYLTRIKLHEGLRERPRHPHQALQERGRRGR